MNDELQERLESQLHEKMLAENEVYLADMKTKPVDEIIRSAYQIAWRENMLYLFESTTSLTARQLEVLLELEQPLSELYDRWLGQDSQEMDLLRGCLENHADHILERKAEEKYSDPAQPIYSKTLREARDSGELLEWRSNHRRNEKCAQMFRQEASISYHERDFPAFLDRWIATYGKERCMLVLASTMQQRKEDDRFSLVAKQAVARCAAHLTVDGNRTWDYAVDTHSGIVNAAMEHLAKPEHTKAKGHREHDIER